MPSKNMLPKGKRRQTVKHEYRAHRTLVQEREAEAKAAAEAAFVEAPAKNAAAYETADWYEVDDRPRSGIITTGARGSKVAEEEEAPPRYADPRLLDEKPKVALPEVAVAQVAEGLRVLMVPAEAAKMRLDAFLAKALPDISRGRVQMLIDAGQVKLDGATPKASHKLEGGERVEVEGEPQPEPLRAEAEDIPLKIVYEDKDLAVIDKAAGMTVHAGSGSAEHNRGTLVNALLFHFGKQLSTEGGALRPGIVHRLDKETSGLIVVAKNDLAHRKLAEMFSERSLRKVYVALVHGALKADEGTVDLPISRDLKRRNRMTTRRATTSPYLSVTGPGYPGMGDSGPQEDFEEEEGSGRGAARMQTRNAVSHYRVLERLNTPFGAFTLVEVQIETGRTHQIRVHMQALGHPVAGDTLYGAPEHLHQQEIRTGKASGKTKRKAGRDVETAGEAPVLDRNFLHAAELDLNQPRTGKRLELRAALPEELERFLDQLREAV